METTERPALSLRRAALYGAIIGIVGCVIVLLVIAWQMQIWSTGFFIAECVRWALLSCLVFVVVAFLFNKVTGRRSAPSWPSGPSWPPT
jgi:hypothetical protein